MSWPSFPQHMQAKASLYSSRVFLEDWKQEKRYTYGEFAEHTSRMAWAFSKLGVGPGDRVAILHPNHTDFVLAYASIIQAGGVAVPINTLYSPGEVSYILEDSGAETLLTTHGFKALLEQIPGGLSHVRRVLIKQPGELLFQTLERACGKLRKDFMHPAESEAPAFIFYTSGTTGRPKGVILNHKNLVFGGANTAQHYGLREDDAALVSLPMVHIFANASPVMGALNSGGRVLIMERFQSAWVLEAMSKARITWFPGVPTMFIYLMEEMKQNPMKLPSLRMGLSGGASLSAEHLTRFQDMFQVPILEVYGLTESTGLVTANPLYGIRKVGSIGVQVAGVSVRLLGEDGNEVGPGEVGEIVFKGPNATPGYWRLPEATAHAVRNGWVCTKDLARKDEQEYYFIVGRKDELMICGGYNIYPREIEEVLYQHWAVGEAAVIGVPHPHLGQVPKAFVVPKAGFSLKPEEIRAFCEARLAPYKVPKWVQILEEMPKSSTGKILKKSLS
ncbi:MAG: AMP-binding protein [bacterium]